MGRLIQTARLELRQFESNDDRAMFEVLTDPEVMRFSIQKLDDLAAVQNWLSDCLEHYTNYGYGKWAVSKNGKVIGYCGLIYQPDLDGQPEVALGYRLARAAWGQGYATEAARAVLEYGFKTLGLSRIVATIDPNNLASIGVAEKVGMRFEKEVWLEGYSYADRLYGATNESFNQRK